MPIKEISVTIHIFLHMYKTSWKIYKKMVTLVASSKGNCMDGVQGGRFYQILS